MRPMIALAAMAVACAALAPHADSACCYFSAIGQDVTQPGQKAFLTWDPDEGIESFIVQPSFTGNATDFGMVVPTPAQPKLAEAPRDLFKALAVYTILKPTNWKKFKRPMLRASGGGGIPYPSAPMPGTAKDSVKVLESGVVGTLDYKVIEATKADDLYAWLKDNGYRYAGDAETLDFYVQKRWYFTVMKIDPKQMKRNADGTYLGEVSPTRFTFPSDTLVYPLRITRISVKDRTEALFYIQAPRKMDFPERFSYQPSYQVMWTGSYQNAVWSECSDAEVAWWEFVAPKQESIMEEFMKWKREGRGPALSRLEWSRRLTAADLGVLTGETPFGREAPEEEIKNLRILSGILKQGRFVTKCRHTFLRGEMDQDLVFVDATFRGRSDSVEHVEILPTSPP